MSILLLVIIISWNTLTTQHDFLTVGDQAPEQWSSPAGMSTKRVNVRLIVRLVVLAIMQSPVEQQDFKKTGGQNWPSLRIQQPELAKSSVYTLVGVICPQEKHYVWKMFTSLGWFRVIQPTLFFVIHYKDPNVFPISLKLSDSALDY